jgi:hypothetical protein
LNFLGFTGGLLTAASVDQGTDDDQSTDNRQDDVGKAQFPPGENDDGNSE